ncbi:MAG: GNAT family N-acetyltransferase [Candidatus Lokiarchaeota archaeon]|nr:GNAT family N-acetyltransferase [Candidatus Lokiarchaeota archaeon]
MKVYFRELTLEDIPAVKEISKDIWEGDDYIPYIIKQWLQEKDCMNYGTFKDENKTELIGFGRVKLYDKEIAWLEGGRIKVSYQGQGVGKLQLGYAVEYAVKSGAKVAQYDTASDNLASISLAKYYGFKRKKCMDLVMVNSTDIKLPLKIAPKVDKLTVKDLQEIYTKFDIGPGDEICIGWSYIPLKYVTDEHGSWIYNRDAILQKVEFGGSHDHELPSEKEVWMIVYGKSKAAWDLIQYSIQKELESKEVKIFEVFCRSDVVELIKEMGFKYHKDERFGVILFEKALN